MSIWIQFVAVGVGLIICAILYVLFYQRTYKEEEGILYIREGKLGKWENLDVHLKREHPEEWAILQKYRKRE